MFCRERSERFRNTPREMPRVAMAGEVAGVVPSEPSVGRKHDSRGEKGAVVVGGGPLALWKNVWRVERRERPSYVFEGTK